VGELYYLFVDDDGLFVKRTIQKWVPSSAGTNRTTRASALLMLLTNSCRACELAGNDP
jgi:hypothetical protein